MRDLRKKRWGILDGSVTLGGSCESKNLGKGCLFVSVSTLGDDEIFYYCSCMKRCCKFTDQLIPSVTQLDPLFGGHGFTI